MNDSPASEPNTIAATATQPAIAFTVTGRDHARLPANDAAPAAATAHGAQVGASGRVATRSTAAAVSAASAARAHQADTRSGSRRTSAPTPTATPIEAKNVTPKYQYGRSRPFHSFHRGSVNTVGNRSGSRLGSGK